MSKNIRIGLAQINTTVGDLDGNRNKIIENISKAATLDCDILVFPELTICGYPPEDLLLRKQFITEQRKTLEELLPHINDIACVVGFVDSQNGKLYNSAAVLQNKKISGIYHKIKLPNYSVFDEERYFKAGNSPMIVDAGFTKIGINICEDIWIKDCVPEAEAFDGGAEILINISASPYHAQKGKERQKLMQNRAVSTRSFIAYCNLIGGQDELVFDGHSLMVDPSGEIIAGGEFFKEDLIVADVDLDLVRSFRSKEQYEQAKSAHYCSFEKLDTSSISIKNIDKNPLQQNSFVSISCKEEEIYDALKLGLHNYVTKNGFSKVTFGLSGGIDSALVATLAADALGKENVTGVTMPSRYSSEGSINDSVKLSKNLGIRLLELPIEKAFNTYLEILADPFKDTNQGVAEENIQARIRGNLVMALSNKFGWLVLPTGNKSEVSVGYATMYGDMAGGFAPLKDVSKMMVYRLCEYRNLAAGFDLIPKEIIEKPPSAELRPDQKDADSLPPYEILDAIIEYYVEHEMSVNEIVAKGFDKDTVRFVARLIDLNEYKRRQAAPGVKITPRAFGKDRRMPITNKYRAR